jgi:hypothetical protein
VFKEYLIKREMARILAAQGVAYEMELSIIGTILNPVTDRTFLKFLQR